MVEENTQKETFTPQTASPQAPTPPQPMKKKKNRGKALMFLGAIALIGVAIFFIVRGLNKEDEFTTVSPTPNVKGVPTSAPTSSPEPADRSEVTIEILNGTGIAREASFLQGKLANLGYTEIETGNAEDQDNEATVVTFASGLSDEVKDEITEELEDAYVEVDVKTSSSTGFDVQVITGLRRGQTPQPETTEEPEATEEPSDSPTPTPTPTTL